MYVCAYVCMFGCSKTIAISFLFFNPLRKKMEVQNWANGKNLWRGKDQRDGLPTSNSPKAQNWSVKSP